MNVAEKSSYLDRHIESIARHDDESASIRIGILEAAKEKIDEEIAAMDDRTAERLKMLLESKV